MAVSYTHLDVYKRQPLYSVKEVGTTDITGTRQQFWPDDTIFTETVYNYDILATRMRELAYLDVYKRQLLDCDDCIGSDNDYNIKD